VSGSPELLFDELLYEVGEAIANHPRSQQKRIGPSEIGTPCARRLGHKLAGTEPEESGDRWRPTVGTAIHTWLETNPLAAANANWAAECGQPRYLLEQEVTVGTIGGVDITGRTDAYDTVTQTVIDFKTAGKTKLAHYRRHGPGRDYHDQVMLYAKGWIAQGRPVDQVMIVWFPRDGDLSTSHQWSAPYDPAIALAALARANRVDAAIKVLGDEAYTITNGELAARGLPMLADAGAPGALALPLDFANCRFCPLLNNGCEGDVAAADAKKAKAFEGLIA
jgi:hypothetical protein